MAKYPYIPSMRPLKKFLQAIQTMGTPKKVNTSTLRQMGFKTSNARYIPPILKFLGFIDASGVPTDDYKNFKKRKMAKSVMVNVLRKAYADLFELYPDAPQKDFVSLRDFFTGTTDAGEAAVKYTVETFKTLCSFADFKAPAIAPTPPPTPLPTPKEPPLVQVGKKLEKEAGLVINLNIQLELPATQDATVYDKIFASLKKHLLTRD